MQHHLLLTAAILLATAIICNGAHAKDVAALPLHTYPIHKIAHDDVTPKAVSDLHGHVDKTGKLLIKSVSDSPQTDNRSLRLRDKKQLALYARLHNFINRWPTSVALHLN